MAAAGLALKEENFEAFKIAFEQTVKEDSKGQHFHPTIEIDKEISFNDITKSF